MLLGVGFGIVISTVIMTGVKINYNLSNVQIEDKARSMGMIYPDEVKVMNSRGASK